jgi:hypothetical protein
MDDGFDPDSVSIETPTEYDDVPNASSPIELLVDGLSRDEATYICQQLSLFVETHDPEALGRFSAALQDATSDQPQSVVRQRFEGGERRPDLEWHTDTDAKFATSD